MASLQIGRRVLLRQLLQSNNNTFRTATTSSIIHLPMSMLIRPTFRSRPVQSFIRSLHSTVPKRPIPLLRRPQNNIRNLLQQPRRWASSTASPQDAQLSLSQRLKKMSKDYGWAALFVYLGLSALDFPFCFLAVKLLGTDTIGHWEHVIVGYIKGLLQWPASIAGATGVEDTATAQSVVEKSVEGIEGRRLLDEKSAQEAETEEVYGIQDHGFKAAEAANKGADASIWTQLALAYAIHKSFIFVRVPLTAAVLPKVVKTLRGWGWNIGPTRKAKAVVGGQAVGVNTKGSGVRPGD